MVPSPYLHSRAAHRRKQQAKWEQKGPRPAWGGAGHCPLAAALSPCSGLHQGSPWALNLAGSMETAEPAADPGARGWQ